MFITVQTDKKPTTDLEIVQNGNLLNRVYADVHSFLQFIDAIKSGLGYERGWERMYRVRFLDSPVCQIIRDMKAYSYLDSASDITYKRCIRASRLCLYFSRTVELLEELLLRETLQGTKRRADIGFAHLMDSHIMRLSEAEAGRCVLGALYALKEIPMYQVVFMSGAFYKYACGKVNFLTTFLTTVFNLVRRLVYSA